MVGTIQYTQDPLGARMGRLLAIFLPAQTT